MTRRDTVSTRCESLCAKADGCKSQVKSAPRILQEVPSHERRGTTVKILGELGLASLALPLKLSKEVGMFLFFYIFICIVSTMFWAPAIIIIFNSLRAYWWATKTINKHYGTWLGACIYVLATQQVERFDLHSFPTFSYSCCQSYIYLYEMKKQEEGLTK